MSFPARELVYLPGYPTPGASVRTVSRYAALAALILLAACGGRPALTTGDVEFAGPAGSGEANLHATADGRAVLTWLEPTASGGHALRLAVRTAGAWSEPRAIVDGREFFVNWADFPSLTTLEGGTWMVHWLEKVASGPYAYHVQVALSADGGATWSAPLVPHRDVSPAEHGFVSMVPWEAGVALVWLDGRAMTDPEETGADGHGIPQGAMTVRFTTVSADGVLGPDVELDPRVCECCQTALARTASGLVAAYRDRSEREIRDIAAVRYVGGRWTEPAPVARDGWHYPGCPVNGPQLSALGDTVAIAWYTAPEQRPRVQLAFSTDGGATFGAPRRVDDGGAMGRVDVELLSGEEAVVTWLEDMGEAAHVRARRVARSGAMGSSSRVAVTTAARASGFPRLARVGDELVVAWTLTGASGGVRVASLRPLD